MSKMRTVEPVSIERIREFLFYEPSTGEFRWVKSPSNRAKVGEVAGTVVLGYVRLTVDRKFMQAHRVAWLLMTGEWPLTDVDHINGNRSDNRFENLRLATRGQNNANVTKLRGNNTSGYRGVIWDHERMAWRAQITVDYKLKVLGRFQTAEQAAAAYRVAADKHFGEFARHDVSRT